MLECTFQRVLLSCIADAKPPQPQDLEYVADKITREMLVGRPMDRNRATRMAHTALCGNANVG